MDDRNWLGLQQWYLKPLGRLFSEMETVHLARLLTPLFGQHLLVMGVPLDVVAASASAIPHRFHLHWTQTAHGVAGDLLAIPNELPIAKESIDVAILHHALEFVSEPYVVLQELNRVLTSDGHILIVGFNPYSLWNIQRLLGLNRLQGVQPASVLQLQRWLAPLDCDVIAICYGFYRPLLASLSTLQKLALMERLGAKWWPMLGSSYVLLAKKRVIPLTSLKTHWRIRRYALPVRVNQPTCGTRI